MNNGKITLVKYKEDGVFNLEWNDSPSAQAYIFKIKKISDNQETILYSSGFTYETSISINTSNLSFQSETPVAGQDYIIEVLAYIFENNAEINLAYNIQSISLSQTTITWQ